MPISAISVLNIIMKKMWNNENCEIKLATKKVELATKRGVSDELN
jgi:hypothetical protein